MEFGLETLALLSLAAFAAGFVDSIAGGGGLLTVPVLMLAGFDPVTAVATNKVQGTTSIISSLYTYHRAGLVEWRASVPIAIAAFACGILGALSIHYLSREVLSALMPVLLIVVAAYFGLSRSMGDADSRRRMPYWRDNLGRCKMNRWQNCVATKKGRSRRAARSTGSPC